MLMAYNAGEVLAPYVSAVKYLGITPLKASRGLQMVGTGCHFVSSLVLPLTELVMRISRDLELNGHSMSMQIHPHPHEVHMLLSECFFKYLRDCYS